jgi:hypothetical protein
MDFIQWLQNGRAAGDVPGFSHNNNNSTQHARLVAVRSMTTTQAKHRGQSNTLKVRESAN